MAVTALCERVTGSKMITITTTDVLKSFCADCAKNPYITVDTEFLRERTYYAQLCLVQIAQPGKDESNAALVDTLAPGLDLEPLYELFRDLSVTKVFHAARQDLEIFYQMGGVIPEPFFDTQVAAMVCGFGDQVGYETLVRKITKSGVDKSSRFTDWSHRPLSDQQKAYAVGDVTFLRQVYEHLAAQLEASGRTAWVEEELEILTNPDTYEIDANEIWRRLKPRSNSGKFLALVRELAKFRETHARARNVPRNRVYKDDALMELASTKPRNLDQLGRSRLLLREARKGDIAQGILDAIETALNTKPEDCPKLPPAPQRKPGMEGLADLLRVLLKAKANDAGVAQKLIATSADLDEIASTDDNTKLRVLSGWRGEVFGQYALSLKRGEIALSANGSGVKIVEL